MNKYNKFSSSGQLTSSKIRLAFAAIMLLSIFCFLIVWPKAPGWFGSFNFHLGLDLQGGSHLVYQADVSGMTGDIDSKDSVEALRDVIERRVNAYGVSEPVVQTNYSGDNYRIIVELAGVMDIDEAIAIIDRTPMLEFKTQAPLDPSFDYEDQVKNRAEEILAKALAGEDFSSLARDYSEDQSSALGGGDLGWVAKGIFVPEFDRAIFDELKIGEISPNLVESQFGYHIIKKKDERLNDLGEREVNASHVLIAKTDADLNYSWQDTALTGRHIQKAQLNFDERTQEPLVLLSFDNEGKDIFAELTAANIGRPIGIFLDGELRSSPIVQEAIRDGQAQISGRFTISEAKSLVKDLNLGALPVPINLISQQTVGATLGNESVAKSLTAGIIGFMAAALFMLVFYRLPGLISVFALFVYTLIVLAIFKMVPVTMTLAGVAGFILSVGMAVDANILIFERSKEELKEGRSLRTAIENGFNRAWPSIRDSNISSIITCLILAWFGTSIIKGFAITLAIGIMVSMFSAITVSRTFLRIIVSHHLEGKMSLFGVKMK
ncbi:MAG: protein translocase subunit SecD [Patescibacteria group bacterium]|nr:protein translocase subunit SecD [Patescibacteria group bacterium]